MSHSSKYIHTLFLIINFERYQYGILHVNFNENNKLTIMMCVLKFTFYNSHIANQQKLKSICCMKKINIIKHISFRIPLQYHASVT